jgi:putative DNA primase/helicase
MDHATGESGTLSGLASLLGCEPPAWESKTGREEKNSPARAEAKSDKSGDAVKLWQSGRPAQVDTEYLRRKHIGAHGCREALIAGEKTLLIPAFNEQGILVGCERIRGNGAKAHLGQKAGAFHLLGTVEDGKPIVVAEGFSTSASIHEFSGFPTVCTFGASNVPTLARRLREKHPDAEIVIAVDNDPAGEKAIRECGAGFLPCVPDGVTHTDWNDIFCLMGRDEAAKVFQEKLKKARREAPKPKDALSLLCGPSPDRAVAPENVWLFPRGHLSVLASDPGAGKSMLMANVAADLSRGGRIIGGREEAARKVLYLNGEAGKALFDARFRLGGWSFDPNNLRVVHLEEAQASEIPLELDTESGRKAIEALVESVHPDLLIVDSLIAFFGGDQNDAQAVRNVTVFLKRLAAQHGMAACLIHHLRKRGLRDTGVEVTLNEIQGSNAILKLVNVVVGIETKTTDDDESTIRVVRPLKTWSRPFPPFAFTFEDGDDDTFRLVFDHEPVLPGDHGKRGAWEALSRAFGHGEPFGRSSVESVCQVSDGLARRYLRDWVSSGKLTREGNNRATEYRVVSLSRELPGTSPDILKKSTVKRESSVIPTIPDGTGGTGKVPAKYRQNRGDSEKPVIPTIPDGTFTSTGSDCCSATVSTFDGTFSGCTGKNFVPEEHPAEAPKIEHVFPSPGASAPGPLVETETFPDDMELPYFWKSKGSWIVAVEVLGDGSRSFGLSQMQGGKPKCWLREPRKAKAA